MLNSEIGNSDGADFALLLHVDQGIPGFHNFSWCGRCKAVYQPIKKTTEPFGGAELQNVRQRQQRKT